MTLQRISNLILIGLLLGPGLFSSMVFAKDSTPIVITHEEDDGPKQDDKPVSPSEIRQYAAAKRLCRTLCKTSSKVSIRPTTKTRPMISASP